MAEVQPVRGEKGVMQRHLDSCDNREALRDEAPARSAPRQTGLHVISKPQAWTAERKKEFQKDYLEMAADANLPLNFAKNPSVQFFFEKYIGQDPPSAYITGGRLLREAIRDLDGEWAAELKGAEVTLTCDGWNNVQRKHIVAFMLVHEGKAYHTGIIDATGEAKDGAHAYEQIVAEIERVEEEFGCKVVAVCTDSGSDVAYARRQLNRSSPHIITIPCYAHQINLVVKDLIAKAPGLKSLSSSIVEAIKWLIHHSQIYDKLRHLQHSLNPLSRILCLILPVITRWTSHLAAIKTLLHFMEAVKKLIREHRRDISENPHHWGGEKKEQRAKSKEMCNLLEATSFWESLTRLQKVLEPLAIAAVVMQSDSSSLSNIFVTFGKLYTSYTQLLRQAEGCEEDGEEDQATASACRAVIDSLETRWLAADQDVIIVAAILNPFLGRGRLYLSTKSTKLATGYLFARIKRVYIRLFGDGTSTTSPPSTSGESEDGEDGEPCNETLDRLFEDWQEYSNNEGRFSEAAMSLTETRAYFRKRKLAPSPYLLWRGLAGPDPSSSDTRPLARLGVRLHGVVSNTAANERLFSGLDSIHTKKRNRFGAKKVSDIARFRSHVRVKRERAKKGLPQRAKRRKAGKATENLADFALSFSQPAETRRAICVANSSSTIPVEDDDSDEMTGMEFEATLRGWFGDINEELGGWEEVDDEEIEQLTLSEIFDLSTGVTTLSKSPGLVKESTALWDCGLAGFEAETDEYQREIRNDFCFADEELDDDDEEEQEDGQGNEEGDATLVE